MPLIKSSSHAAQTKNFNTELHAIIAKGKSPQKAAKQAYAISKSVQRRSK